MGSFLETFVAGELLKLIAGSERQLGLYHFRTATRHEVDFVVEDRDGSVIGGDDGPQGLGWLKESTALMPDLSALKNRLDSEGYIFLRNILPKEDVLKTRNSILDILASEGYVDSKDPSKAISIKLIPKNVKRKIAQHDSALRDLLYGNTLVPFFEGILEGPVRHLDFTGPRTISLGVGKNTLTDLTKEFMQREPVTVLDGLAVSKALLAGIVPRVEAVKQRLGFTPVLATILVGNDPSSATYVKMKGNTCRKVGMESKAVTLAAETTTEQLLQVITSLNNDPSVCGILLQHPVPRQIDERACFDSIALNKDVDGVTSSGFGKISLGSRAFGSATPQGIMELLKAYNIVLEGKSAVVIGRSPILGKPMAMMLLNANATVTIYHSKTRNLNKIISDADLIVGAVGIPEFIKADWIKSGAIVIDAGYHKIEWAGEQIQVGDIEPSAFQKSAAFTPVPGGVGPMTIATLISQTLESAEALARSKGL